MTDKSQDIRQIPEKEPEVEQIADQIPHSQQKSDLRDQPTTDSLQVPQIPLPSQIHALQSAIPAPSPFETDRELFVTPGEFPDPLDMPTLDAKGVLEDEDVAVKVDLPTKRDSLVRRLDRNRSGQSSQHNITTSQPRLRPVSLVDTVDSDLTPLVSPVSSLPSPKEKPSSPVIRHDRPVFRRAHPSILSNNK